MGGLDSLPDASTVAQITIAATGESPDDLRIAGRGVTALAWRVEARGGPYCVLVGLPPQPEDAPFPGAAPRFEARAALLAALRERDERCPEVFATSSTPGVPERLRRWPWMVTDWMRGVPLGDASAMTPELAREVGEFLAVLHAIPAEGYGLMADVEDAEGIRGISPDPGAGLSSRWCQPLWPFDGRPLAAHPLVRVAPQLVLPVSALREQLLPYVDEGARVVCHMSLGPEHIWTDSGHLAGVIDFGDAEVLPPAMDIANFAYEFGWDAAEWLLEGYAANRVLRDIRRAEASHLGVLMALEDVERWTRHPRPDDRAEAIRFLEATLPHATRRIDA